LASQSGRLDEQGAGGCYRIYHLPQFYWVFSNRVLCTRVHGPTLLPAPIKALPCLWIFLPMAEKSKPPALRVVADSRGTDVGAFAFGQFNQQPYHYEFISLFPS